MHPEHEPTPLLKRLQLRLAQARFLTFSMLLHAVIVITCGGLVIIKNIGEDVNDFVAPGGDLVNTEIILEAPKDEPTITPQDFTPPPPAANAPIIPPITVLAPQQQFAMAPVQPVMKPISEPRIITDPIPIKTGKLSGVNPNLPASMMQRMGGKAREAAMALNKGKPKSEEAVLRGLRWLVKNQNEDGSWSRENRPAMTGFALLSFLGHGELPTSPEFGPTVQKAVEWLLKQGTEFQGRLSMTKGGWGASSGVYEHAIAAYALGEYYTMTKDDRAEPLFKQAIDYIVQGQGPDGGWMYSYDKSQSDTSVSGWQIQALKAAYLSGLKIEGLDSALDKAVLNLKRVQGDRGGFGYRTAEDRYSLTGVGVLCTYFLLQKKDELIRDGIKFMLDKDHPPVKYGGANADLYAWYYNTQACLMVGGGPWTKWNGMFQDELCTAQSPDGSWPPVSTKSPGPLTKPDGAGPFYRTNLCILMLEVYYRYAPTTKG
ncbi:MAG: hypothetical protein QOE70_4498 [Chthoniobacter sp.]|jgi:hypothetical protein|nr:hypothetical protein [Chthoniobacter sp.]